MHVLIKRKLEGPSIPELGQPTSTTFDSVTVPVARPSTGPAALASYELQRSLDGTTWSTIATGPSIFGNPAAQYVDGGRLALTRYYYRARATDVAGRVSDFCAPVDVATSAGAQTSEVPAFNAATPNKVVNRALVANGTTVFSTIQAAVNTANPGDVIGVAPGAYHEAVLVTRSGTAGSPIYIQALDPNNRPRIDGQMTLPIGWSPATEYAPGGTRLVSIAASHVVWDGIDIVNSRDQGLVVGPPNNNGGFVENNALWYSNVKVLRTRIEKTNAFGVTLFQTDGAYMGGCVIRETCRQSDALWNSTTENPEGWGAALFVLGKNVSVIETEISQSLGEGIHCGHHIFYGVNAFIQVENLLVRKCRIFDTFSSPVYVAHVDGGILERNAIYMTGDARFWYGRSSRPEAAAGSGVVAFGSEGAARGGAPWSTGYIGSVNVTLRNNVISGGRTLLSFNNWPSQLFRGIRIEHNTLFGVQPGMFPAGSGVLANSMTNLTDLTFRNNVIHDAAGRIVSSDGGWLAPIGSTMKGHNLWSHTAPASLQGAGDVTNAAVGLTNVSYVPSGAWPSSSNFDTESFKLTAASPALAAGVASAVTNDFFGTARPASPDMGAHERS